MIRGLEDGLDYKDIAFVNEMSECPIQVLERSERTARMHASVSGSSLARDQGCLGDTIVAPVPCLQGTKLLMG